MNTGSVFSYIRQINASKMTLPGLRAIEDKVLMKMSAVSAVGGQAIFAAIEEQRGLLKKREIVRLQGGGTTAEVTKLYLNQNVLAPSEIEEKIAVLRGVAGRNQLLERLEFQSVEPLAHEFDPDSPESTFRSRLESVAREIRETDSVEPYKEYLSPEQQEAIGGKGGPEGVAHAVETYTESLSAQVDAAQAFYFGRMQEGMRKLARLPEDVQQTIAAKFSAEIMQGVEEQVNGG